MIIKKSILLLVIIIANISLSAQSDCEQELKRAIELYKNGMYQQAVTILNDKISNCHFSNEEKQTIYKTLISCNKELDEQEEANRLTMQFLRKYPIYQVNKSFDDPSFVECFQRFTTRPVFTLNVSGGFNVNSVHINKKYRILDDANYNDDYQTDIKPTFQLELQWNLNKNISLNTGLYGLRYQNYSRKIVLYDSLNMNYKETFNHSKLPLYLKLSVPYKKFSAEIYAGLEIEMLRKAEFSLSFSSESASWSQFITSRNGFDGISVSVDNRNKLRPSVIYGARINYTIKRFNMFLDFRYVKEINTYNNPLKRYVNSNLIYNAYFIEDDIILYSYDISVGISFNFFYRIKSKY